MENPLVWMRIEIAVIKWLTVDFWNNQTVVF